MTPGLPQLGLPGAHFEQLQRCGPFSDRSGRRRGGRGGHPGVRRDGAPRSPAGQDGGARPCGAAAARGAAGGRTPRGPGRTAGLLRGVQPAPAPVPLRPVQGLLRPRRRGGAPRTGPGGGGAPPGPATATRRAPTASRWPCPPAPRRRSACATPRLCPSPHSPSPRTRGRRSSAPSGSWSRATESAYEEAPVLCFHRTGASSYRVSNGTRTRDILDHNQVLYHLSYTHHVRAFPTGREKVYRVREGARALISRRGVAAPGGAVTSAFSRGAGRPARPPPAPARSPGRAAGRRPPRGSTAAR